MPPPFAAAGISRKDGAGADGIHLLWTAPVGAGYAAEGYDIVRLIAEAIAASNGTPLTGSSVRDFLYHVQDYAGASGAITFDKNGDVVKPFAIRTIEAGNPKTIVVK